MDKTQRSNNTNEMDDSQRMNRMQSQSAEGSIDTPGNNLPLPRRPANDATPEAVLGSSRLSPDRAVFLRTMNERGRFPSIQETERWAQGVFDALRHHALEQDSSLMAELGDVIKVGEAPETQVREMMWAGDFLTRMTQLASFLKTWNRQEFYKKVADESGTKPGDPWVEAAVSSFFSALKEQLGTDADRSLPNLGELQQTWHEA